MDEAAEWPLPHDLGVYGDGLAIDPERLNIPFRLAIAAGHAFGHLAARRHGLAERGVRQRIDRVLEEQPRGIGGGAIRPERRMLHFVPVIEGKPVYTKSIECHRGPSDVAGATLPRCFFGSPSDTAAAKCGSA